MDRIIVVIVSWNTQELTRDCLRSLHDELCELDIDRQVWVVDNCSADGSVEMIRNEFPEVTLIQNQENIGFARANNQVLRKATGSLYLLLNSDTIVPRGSIKRMLSFMREMPEVTAVGPKLTHPDGAIQRSFWQLPSLSGELRYCLVHHFFPFRGIFESLFRYQHRNWKSIDGPIEVQALSAAALLIRKQVLDRVGLLAEDYFLFSEENDYFYRMRQASLKCCYLPDVEIVHLVGASRKKRGSIDSQVNFLKSRIIYFRLHQHHSVRILRAIYSFFLGWSYAVSVFSYVVKGRKNDEYVRLYCRLLKTLSETD